MFNSPKIKFITLSGSVLIAAVCYFVFFAGYTIVNTPPKNLHIVAFGDSLVAGVGSEVGGGFVPVLSDLLGLSIDNVGLSGDTTKNGLSRLEEDVLLQNPGVVLVLLGGNDYLKKVPKEETFDNLEKIIHKIQVEGAVVVLLGVQGGVLFDTYDSSYKKLAKDTGSVYVENVLDGLIGDSQYMDDTIHPNDVGYEYIAQKIAQEIYFLIP